MAENTLYYGDNLDVLRRHIPDANVDLVYLDPPFKSDQNYNVLFASKDGTDSAAQIQAFEDTWRWDEIAARQFDETVRAGDRVADVMLAFRQFLGTNDMLAYLAMMAPRLVELRRVLKDTGSLYLHCDPTASHYLKLLLDAVFGPQQFRNEVVWQRTTNTGSSKAVAKRFSTDHDVILAYAKHAARCRFNPEFRPYTEEYVKRYYIYDDGDGRGPYQVQALATYSKERLAELQRDNRIVAGKGRVLRFKDYLKGKKGVVVGDIWTDIEPVNPVAREKLGYPTQKPEALLERIIAASTGVGDVVLDPFCGCGTTIAAAHKLDRRWIGIDVTHLAIGLIKSRLQDAFGSKAAYHVVGEPTTVEGAERLAEDDPYQFQYWALGLVGARGVEKKGADKGIDGRLIFGDGRGKYEQIVLSVKAGKLHANYVRDLRGVIEREKAAIGVLITFEDPTRKMREEAAAAGMFETPWGRHPRLQLRTVAELLDGNGIDYPRTEGINQTFRRAPKARKSHGAGPDLFAGE